MRSSIGCPNRENSSTTVSSASSVKRSKPDEPLIRNDDRRASSRIPNRAPDAMLRVSTPAFFTQPRKRSPCSIGNFGGLQMLDMGGGTLAFAKRINF